MMMLVRHWRFVYESIQDLQKLNPINATIYFFHNEVATVFKIGEQYEIKPFFHTKK
jgi:deoxyribodipyrimidine photo-lyase